LTILNRAITYALNLGLERKNVRINSLFILPKTGLLLLLASIIASSLAAESLTFWNPSKNIGVEVVIPNWTLEKKVVSKTENGIKEDGQLYSNIKVYQYDDDPSIWKNFSQFKLKRG